MLASDRVLPQMDRSAIDVVSKCVGVDLAGYVKKRNEKNKKDNQSNEKEETQMPSVIKTMVQTAVKEAEESTTKILIRNLMSTRKVTVEQAMNDLMIPEEQRSLYLKELA